MPQGIWLQSSLLSLKNGEQNILGYESSAASSSDNDNENSIYSNFSLSSRVENKTAAANFTATCMLASSSAVDESA